MLFSRRTLAVLPTRQQSDRVTEHQLHDVGAEVTSVQMVILIGRDTPEAWTFMLLWVNVPWVHRLMSCLSQLLCASGKRFLVTARNPCHRASNVNPHTCPFLRLFRICRCNCPIPANSGQHRAVCQSLLSNSHRTAGSTRYRSRAGYQPANRRHSCHHSCTKDGLCRTSSDSVRAVVKVLIIDLRRSPYRCRCCLQNLVHQSHAARCKSQLSYEFVQWIVHLPSGTRNRQRRRSLRQNCKQS